ncbi:helical backbone metal receptor [Metasolibacillus meyeri]|uniref:Helical backbone metal receptor n=1 Tax=Metasolibacillus meyeri TaxID=1071052 RepID=A0AAW9NUC6_9BACL|nr:helical backbone metal receptor [Metasolibacillus meyeri]MEC1178376.1 helical backbone metal receptor [Metasolibacillus meyeri]
MRTITDHIGRQVLCSSEPKRIISICPAITETLFALGAEEQLVGRTKYCIFPKGQIEKLTAVGGTKQVDVDVIKQLQPDLILAEKEENTEEIVKQLEQIAPVFVAEVQSIEDGYRLIDTLGMLINRHDKATELVGASRAGFASLAQQNRGRAAYVIWRKPYMVVGATTYINDVLARLGFDNPLARAEGRYPSVSKEQFQEAQLDVLFLASEPFPYSEKYIAEFQAFLPNTKIVLVDGEMFWYGAKMVEATAYFTELVKQL